MNTLQLAKIKQFLLQEIGDASAQPYDWDVTKDTEETREYEFETESTPPTKYIVDLYELEPDPDDETNPGVSLKINFSTADEEGDKDYRSLTNKGELYRVMSTIAEIIKYDIQHRPQIKTIFFEPSRRPDKDTLSQNARANLYIKFITHAFPQIDPRRDIENDYGYISVRLPDRFKKNKLQEIGDASKAPYGPISTVYDHPDERDYEFDTNPGDPSNIKYQVNVMTSKIYGKNPNEDLIVSRVGFGVITQSQNTNDKETKKKFGDKKPTNTTSRSISYDTQTGKNDIYRIMSTITSIVKTDLESNKADILRFSSSKRSGNKDEDPMTNVRTQLYSRYIKGQFKDAEVKALPNGDIQVTLPNSKSNP
jgi:hypothetical protein